MRKTIAISFLLLSGIALQAQDVIERTYFPDAQAKNAAIAAARYAEEGYYYTKFTTFITTIDSSRVYADTALFFIKRAQMLADTSISHAPRSNTDALNFLNNGIEKSHIADSIIRRFYPMSEIGSHNVFGIDASLHLSNSVMDFFNASLLLDGSSDEADAGVEPYVVLPFGDEIKRLEADETAFQHVANFYEGEIAELENLAADINAEIANAPDQKTRYSLRTWLDETNLQMSTNTAELQDASFRIQEIRYLLDRKYLDDLKNVEQPEHVSKFETADQGQKEVLMDEEVPDGLVYKIQLGYYPEKEDINNFYGLFPITGETVKKDLARFYAGLFFSYADASAGNKYVREKAIANAFIVPFHNGRKISVSRAVEIERARGIK